MPEVFSVPGYHIVREYGRHGFTTYHAMLAATGEHVHLHVVHAAGEPGKEAAQKLRTRAGLLRRLEHPNVVRVVEVGEAEGTGFFAAFEYTLMDLATHVGGSRFPPAMVALWARAVAGAAQHARDHAARALDLSPNSIMMTTASVPKLADFELVDAERRPGILGPMSLEHAAPEELSGQVTPATDVYRIGATLYQMLAQQPPLGRADRSVDWLREAAKRTPPPIRPQNAAVSEGLEAVCLKCLEKSPANRYATPGELAAELGRLLATPPVASGSAAEVALEPLRLVGDWYVHPPGKKGGVWVEPRKLVDSQWAGADRARLVHYLKHGRGLTIAMSGAPCAFGCGLDGSRSEQTDGTWVWPEYLAHYVFAHGVALPDEFLAHARARGFAIPPKEPDVKVREHERPVSEEAWLSWAARRNATGALPTAKEGPFSDAQLRARAELYVLEDLNERWAAAVFVSTTKNGAWVQPVHRDGPTADVEGAPPFFVERDGHRVRFGDSQRRRAMATLRKWLREKRPGADALAEGRFEDARELAEEWIPLWLPEDDH